MSLEVLKTNDLIITSKGRFGRILKIINQSENEVFYEILIGSKIVKLNASQCRLAKHTTPLNVYFKYKHNGEEYEEKDIVHLSQNTELYNSSCESSVKEVVELYLFNKLGIKVEVTSIKTI